MSWRLTLEITGAVLLAAVVAVLVIAVNDCDNEREARISAEHDHRSCVESSKHTLEVVRRTHDIAIATERKIREAALRGCEEDCEARLAGDELANELLDDEARLIETIEGLIDGL